MARNKKKLRNSTISTPRCSDSSKAQCLESLKLQSFDDSPALPEAFVERCRQHPATADLPEVLLNTPPEISIRYNRLKGVTPTAGADIVPWWSLGCYLDERPAFTFDPALHQGLYYVQDASSMFLANIVSRLSRDMVAPVYLDACAAPGGKTTAAIDALPETALVVANEYDPKRASALVENIRRWGSASVLVTRGDTARFRHCEHMFDIIATDVPCSGEGMMRKEPRAVSQWSPHLIESCATLQREIVSNVWPAVKPGGYLIYSTCTFNLDENEHNLQWIVNTLGAIPVDLELDGQSGITGALEGCLPCYHFIPGQVRGEGLFIAVLRKPGNSQSSHDTTAKPTKRLSKSKSMPASLTTAQISALNNMLTGDYTYELGSDGNIIALPSRHAMTMNSLADTLGGVILKGLNIATLKGRDIIPTYDLARAIDYNPEALPRVDIDRDTALDYLRRLGITIPDAPLGPVMLWYNNHPLGPVKNLGTRANNLLPAPDRILSSPPPKSRI